MDKLIDVGGGTCRRSLCIGGVVEESRGVYVVELVAFGARSRRRNGVTEDGVVGNKLSC